MHALTLSLYHAHLDVLCTVCISLVLVMMRCNPLVEKQSCSQFTRAGSWLAARVAKTEALERKERAETGRSLLGVVSYSAADGITARVLSFPQCVLLYTWHLLLLLSRHHRGIQSRASLPFATVTLLSASMHYTLCIHAMKLHALIP